MTILVNSGTYLVVGSGGLIITADSTLLGELDGPGTISGAFELLTEGGGSAVGAGANGALTIDTASFSNQGAVSALQSDVTIAPGVAVENLANGTLTGGIWDTENAVISIPGGTITNDAATLQFIGTGGMLEPGTTPGSTQPIQDTLSTVSAGAVLQLDSVGVWSMPGTFVDSGLVSLDHFIGGGDTFSAAGGITVTAGGTFIADGTIASPLTLDGTLYVQGSVT